jgi:hypothetical protein
MFAMPGAAATGGPAQRPEFMAVLGLLPPYALEDVREAYRQKALTSHPDRGGDPAEFVRLSDAYDRAIEYVKFHGDRRAWIANQVECHLLQEEVAAEVTRRKGQVEYERMDWVKDSWGDGFEVFANRLRCIRVRGLTNGDAFLAYLGTRHLPFLMGLDLASCQVTDAGLHHLANYGSLHWLDLSNTRVTYAGLRIALKQIPSLTRLNIRNLGWLRRRLLARDNPRVSIVAEIPGKLTSVTTAPADILLPDR